MPEKNEVIVEAPLTDFQKFARAQEDFKRAMWEHHPLFILARRILEWLESLQKRIRVWNPRYIPNPFYSPSLAVIEGWKKAVGSKKEAQDLIKRLNADIAFRCAIEGHTYREVPGIEGVICVACGERPEAKDEGAWRP